MQRLPNEQDYEIAKPITVLYEKARAFNLVIKKAQTNNCSLARMFGSVSKSKLFYCSIPVNWMYMHNQSPNRHHGD